MRRVLAGAVALLAMWACGDSTGPEPDPAGTLRLSLPAGDGRLRAPFDASGVFRLSPDTMTGVGAVGYGWLKTSDEVTIFAAAPAGNGRFHFVDLHFAGTAGSVLSAARDCRGQSCANVAIQTDAIYTMYLDRLDMSVACISRGGWVRITERDTERIKGTFTLTFECAYPVEQGLAYFEYSLNDGSFDVPLVDRAALSNR